MVNKKIYNLYGFFVKISGFERGMANFIKDLNLNCPANSRILDCGCGTGVVGISLMRKFQRSTLLATDSDKRFLRQTITNAKKGGFVKSRISMGFSDITSPDKVRLPNSSLILLRPQSFDIVSVGGAIGYSKNQKKTIKTLLSLIKPGGYFINLELNEGILGKWISKRYHYPIMPLVKIKSIIENEGYRLLSIPFSIRDFPANLTRTCFIAKIQ